MPRAVTITRSGNGIEHAHAGGASSFTALTADQNQIPAARTNEGGVAVQFGEMPEGTGPPFHTHPTFDEVFIILEGTVEFQVHDEVHTAHPGDLVHIPGEIPHAPKCVKGNNNGVAKIIMLVTPARYEDFFHKLGEVIASGGGQKEITNLGAEYGIEFLERPPVRVRH